MTLELFDTTAPHEERIALGHDACVLRRWALPELGAVAAAIDAVTALAPLRHFTTPGGFRMSVAMTCCGDWGWTSDRHGYRYVARDPQSNRPWPAMPEALRSLAIRGAAAAGFTGFEPDACLINRYAVGSRLTLHQDRNERDLDAPVVSVSLGLPAVFLFGGAKRTDPVERIGLMHGDIVVWGGVDRLRFHGIAPLKAGWHGQFGAHRFNLTFRRSH